MLTVEEFQSWQEFYTRWPFDDYSRQYRPAALIASVMSGEPVELLLDWLERKAPATDGFSAADLVTMKAFGLKPPRKD